MAGSKGVASAPFGGPKNPASRVFQKSGRPDFSKRPASGPFQSPRLKRRAGPPFGLSENPGARDFFLKKIKLT